MSNTLGDELDQGILKAKLPWRYWVLEVGKPKAHTQGSEVEDYKFVLNWEPFRRVCVSYRVLRDWQYCWIESPIKFKSYNIEYNKPELAIANTYKSK